MRPDHAMVLSAVAARAQAPLVVLALWLLFAGHNLPGGGFVAGLVLAVAVSLSRTAGAENRLSRLARVEIAIPAGLAIVVLTAVAPMAWGRPLLDAVVWTMEVPVAGSVKTGSALIFDVGVLWIVAGLVSSVAAAFVDSLSGLGLEELS